MRANILSQLSLAAATLLLGCNSTTAPRPIEDPPDILVLTVQPSSATIDGGRAIKLTALMTGRDALGTPQAAVTWFSSDTNVATVRSGGLVEGRKAGRVQIVASWQTARGSALVTVLDPVRKKPSIPQCLLIPGGKC